MAQETQNQVWPEGDIFVNLNENSRLLFLVSGNRIEDGGSSKGTLEVHLDLFTSPLFKKRMEIAAKRADIAPQVSADQGRLSLQQVF